MGVFSWTGIDVTMNTPHFVLQFLCCGPISIEEIDIPSEYCPFRFRHSSVFKIEFASLLFISVIIKTNTILNEPTDLTGMRTAYVRDRCSAVKISTALQWLDLIDWHIRRQRPSACSRICPVCNLNLFHFMFRSGRTHLPDQIKLVRPTTHTRCHHTINWT